MAEINYNTMFDQLSDLEKQQYEGVMGMGGFKTQYEKNPDSPLVTQNPNYEKFKQIADTQAQIPKKGIMGMLNPFSSASASEVTPGTYKPNNSLQQKVGIMNQFDLPFNYSADDLQARAIRAMTQPGLSMQLEKNDPNIPDEIEFLDGQKFTATRYDPYNDPSLNRATTTSNELMDIEDFLGTSTPQDLGFIGMSPSIKEAVAPIGITDRGRSGAFASPEEMGAYEMIGGTPVAIGDVLGRQQALEKADFYEEPTTKRNAFNDLLGVLSLAYTGPYQGGVKVANLANNIRTGKVGQIASKAKTGINSLATKMRGGYKSQSAYEQARADRKQQSRVDYVADRLAKGKKTLSDPYSIAKTEAQKQQIRDGRIKGAEKKAAKDPYSGYGSCFIAGTKVSMADGTFKNIEYVKVGDKIKGHKEDNTVIKLDPTSLGDRKLYSFNDNKHYFFTSEHPFMTEEGWKSIKPEKTKERDGVELYEQLKGELKVGDKLVTDNGLVEITNIDSKEMNSPEMSLYNFNVSNDNSYIADGYIVHNKGGGGGKIVCTMMNERYGFGFFRNKIWMKFHEGYSKDYIKGYHAIFLPLVKIAKGEGKINTAVRKVLEHMGRHVTADMFKIMKGKKRDTLGRIYRAIFEPTCHIIGKIKSALGRG